MRESDARRLARIGEFYIQEAILGLLDDAPRGLMHGDISGALNLPGDGYNATVTGQLHRLEQQGKVHQPRGKRTEWTLTEDERRNRLGDAV